MRGMRSAIHWKLLGASWALVGVALIVWSFRELSRIGPCDPGMEVFCTIGAILASIPIFIGAIGLISAWAMLINRISRWTITATAFLSPLLVVIGVSDVKNSKYLAIAEFLIGVYGFVVLILSRAGRSGYPQA